MATLGPRLAPLELFDVSQVVPVHAYGAGHSHASTDHHAHTITDHHAHTITDHHSLTSNDHDTTNRRARPVKDFPQRDELLGPFQPHGRSGRSSSVVSSHPLTAAGSPHDRQFHQQREQLEQQRLQQYRHQHHHSRQDGGAEADAGAAAARNRPTLFPKSPSDPRSGSRVSLHERCEAELAHALHQAQAQRQQSNGDGKLSPVSATEFPGKAVALPSFEGKVVGINLPQHLHLPRAELTAVDYDDDISSSRTSQYGASSPVSFAFDSSSCNSTPGAAAAMAPPWMSPLHNAASGVLPMIAPAGAAPRGSKTPGPGPVGGNSRRLTRGFGSSGSAVGRRSFEVDKSSAQFAYAGTRPGGHAPASCCGQGFRSPQGHPALPQQSSMQPRLQPPASAPMSPYHQPAASGHRVAYSPLAVVTADVASRAAMSQLHTASWQRTRDKGGKQDVSGREHMLMEELSHLNVSDTPGRLSCDVPRPVDVDEAAGNRSGIMSLKEELEAFDEEAAPSCGEERLVSQRSVVADEEFLSPGDPCQVSGRNGSGSDSSGGVGLQSRSSSGSSSDCRGGSDRQSEGLSVPRKSSDGSGVYDCLEYFPKELEAATGGWSEDNVLGKGCYGKVYRGILRGCQVAVKRLDLTGKQGVREYCAEVEVLGQLMRHPHIVLLLGHSPEDRCLVYEYLPGGSLHDYLRREDLEELNPGPHVAGHGGMAAAAAGGGSCGRPILRGLSGLPPQQRPPLLWTRRVRILSEIVSALVFLHRHEPPIVHRDLKPENVLLTAQLDSKLGDAGLAKLLDDDDAAYTARISGTFGYIDPEIMTTLEVSVSCDTYAFGLIVLQLVTGASKVASVHKLIGEASSPTAAAYCLPPAPLGPGKRGVHGRCTAAFLARLDLTAGEWPEDVALRLVDLGLRCASRSRSQRPDLVEEVLPILEELVDVAERKEEERKEGSMVIDCPAAEVQKMEQQLMCPLSKKRMTDPVLAADGFTYERVAIEAWMQRNTWSALTGEQFVHLHLVPNNSLRTMLLQP